MSLNNKELKRIAKIEMLVEAMLLQEDLIIKASNENSAILNGVRESLLNVSAAPPRLIHIQTKYEKLANHVCEKCYLRNPLENIACINPDCRYGNSITKE